MIFPNHLYKFSPLRDDFFKNRLIRLTPKTQLNDPYELHPSQQDISEIRNLIPEFPANFSNITDSMLANNHFNTMGVMSFTESIDNLLMWAHYANEHRGIVIEFDPSHEFFKELKPVIYLEKRFTGSSLNIHNESAFLREDIFLEKSKHWEYEKEWRIVESLIKSDCLIKFIEEDGETRKVEEWYPNRVDLFPWEPPGLYMMQVPSEAILSFTFGCRVQESEIKKTLDLLETLPEFSHTIKYKTRQENDNYRLTYEKL